MSKSRKAMKEAKGGPPPLRQECFISTLEDWHPNFDGKYVRLFVVEFVDSDGYRVAVWGADDTGMERDFEVTERSSALELYELLKGCGPVTRSDLTGMGMVPG